MENKEVETENYHPADGFFSETSYDWQLELLESLITIYQLETNISHTKLALQILEFTNQNLSKATLNRLLNRYAKRKRVSLPNNSEHETYEVIASFLSHLEIGLLNLEHLKFRSFPTTAPIAFVNSLSYDTEASLPHLHASFTGSYEATSIGEGGTSHFIFSIEVDQNKSWFVSRLIEAPQSRQGLRKRFLIYDGWGVLTPENALLIHTKRQSYGVNLFLASLAGPLDYTEQRPDTFSIVLQNLSDPWEVQENRTEAQIKLITKERIVENIHYFQYGSNFFSDEKLISDTISEDGEEDAETKQGDAWADVSQSPFLKNSRYSRTENLSESHEVKLVEKDMDRLERQFLKASQSLEIEDVEGYLDAGVSINAVDSKTGATALHYAVGDNNREMVRALIKRPDIDYRILDNRGRTAANLAAMYEPIDWPVARLLQIKEVQQTRRMMAENSPDLPPGLRSLDHDDI